MHLQLLLLEFNISRLQLVRICLTRDLEFCVDRTGELGKLKVLQYRSRLLQADSTLCLITYQTGVVLSFDLNCCVSSCSKLAAGMF